MNFSKRPLPALAAGILLAPALASVALAGPAGSDCLPLVTGTLNTPGDLTLDPNTGLEFLDVNSTAGLSFNQTLLTPFVTQQGFRIATFEEFTRLLADAGLTDFSGTFNTADQPAAENLLDNLLGETIPPGQPFLIDPPGTQFDANISDGFYSFVSDAPGTPAGLVNVVGVDYQSAALGQAPQNQTRIIQSLNQVPPDAAPPIVGGLLVRETTGGGGGPAVVPLPAGVWGGGLTLGGLGLARIARRRKGATP